MPLPVERARALITEIQSPGMARLFAQVHAKHVLHEVRENPVNFPAFDPKLDDKVTFAVYGLLSAGCSLIEAGERLEGMAILERGASLLHYAQSPSIATSRVSAFHELISAMAFYAAGHYSRAFVVVRAVEGQTEAARIIAAFLRKDFGALIPRLNAVLLQETGSFEDQAGLDNKVLNVAIARAIAEALEFIFTGDSGSLTRAFAQLSDAAIVASEGGHPGWWWVVRLLRLMLTDLGESSPWKVLPPYFGPDEPGMLKKYIQLLSFSRRSIAELWTSQRAALPLALESDRPGIVLNLRTSAGKTRVAELAILQLLISNPEARIFYLAPFRSLALEIEQTLWESLGRLGYSVSHLYGGSRISAVDTELAADSAITIATPEKARALFRAAPELFGNVKLLVLDEGHLIGPSERYVRNEIFIDHLRMIAKQSGARILLLSAVLPNPEQLAEWIGGDPTAVAASDWRPSAERFGFLRWQGDRVRIEWLGKVRSFNPSFVTASPLGFGRRKRLFPANKAEAIAAAAVTMSAIGPVMIFTGMAVSVPTFAKATLLALGEAPASHPWPEHEWSVFEAVCQEELAPDAIEFQAARAGVVCHSNRLTSQVRLAMESLMRSYPPRVIIATTTLAQGVNVGISTVIIANPYIGNSNVIDKRDFWNICGRAGRAFVDGEGKILYTIDDTRAPWQIRQDLQLARNYFQGQGGDPVESGLLFLVQRLRSIAQAAGVSFDLLLELSAENDFDRLGGVAKEYRKLCDFLDDELLALHTDPTVNDLEESLDWVDVVFRESLAAIQAGEVASSMSVDDLCRFLKTRVASVLEEVEDGQRRKAIIACGLPLRVAIRASDALDHFRTVADLVIAQSGELSALIVAVKEMEGWARENAGDFIELMPDSETLEKLRAGWLSGVSLRELCDIDEKAREVCKDFYCYYLAWLIHAASQQLRVAGDQQRAEVLARIALLVEIGVPSELAARIFLAGIRSRVAAVDLAESEINFGSTVTEIGKMLRNTKILRRLRELVTDGTGKWLDIMEADAANRVQWKPPRFTPFTLPGFDEYTILHARRQGEDYVLCSTNGSKWIKVTPTSERPFNQVADNSRFTFVRDGRSWYLKVRDPKVAGYSDET